MEIPARSRLRNFPTTPVITWARYVQCMPDTARIWERPDRLRSAEADTESPVWSPVRIAVRKAAISPEKKVLICRPIARPSRIGTHRRESSVPLPVLGSPRE